MTPLTTDREREAESLIESVCLWARGRRDVRAVALVGSWARGAARLGSDIDLIVLTTDVAGYINDEQWTHELGATDVVCTRKWGPLTERRLALPGGLEVEIGVVAPSWACTEPLDEGTAQVVSGGLPVLHDPDGLLGALVAAAA